MQRTRWIVSRKERRHDRIDVECAFIFFFFFFLSRGQSKRVITGRKQGGSVYAIANNSFHVHRLPWVIC